MLNVELKDKQLRYGVLAGEVCEAAPCMFYKSSHFWDVLDSFFIPVFNVIKLEIVDYFHYLSVYKCSGCTGLKKV